MNVDANKLGVYVGKGGRMNKLLKIYAVRDKLTDFQFYIIEVNRGV